MVSSHCSLVQSCSTINLRQSLYLNAQPMQSCQTGLRAVLCHSPPTTPTSPTSLPNYAPPLPWAMVLEGPLSIEISFNRMKHTPGFPLKQGRCEWQLKGYLTFSSVIASMDRSR